jgi:hypothetical protein
MNTKTVAAAIIAVAMSSACLALFLVCASRSRANAWNDDWQNMRWPLGVYVKVDVETAINGYPGPVSPSPAELHRYLRKLYAGLLANPAISGITIGQHWDHIQVSDNDYDWSYLDDAFEEAHSAHKPVQLTITAGVDSPPWLFAKIPPCDGLFTTGLAPPDCGTVTFVNSPESDRADGNVFPLPWNRVYLDAWQDFLMHLNARYGYDPAFVSIAIAGPAVGASPEIILPTSDNDMAPQPSGKPVDAMWSALIQHSFPYIGSYQNTDQVFIDQWKQAIDASEKIFAGLTLVISPDLGDALPEFRNNPIRTVHPDNILFAQDCKDAIAAAAAPLPTDTDFRSCEAKTEILSYFVTVAGPNAKATQVGGLTASSPKDPGNIGIAGVKLLTSLSPPPSPLIRGGAEFDFPVSGSNRQEEGCPSFPKGILCQPLTVVDAAYNVLNDFFNGTPAATIYGGTLGPAPIHYLEVPYVDVQYAEMHPCPTELSTFHGKTSLQDLLNGANYDLFEMANRRVLLPPPTCNH